MHDNLSSSLTRDASLLWAGMLPPCPRSWPGESAAPEDCRVEVHEEGPDDVLVGLRDARPEVRAALDDRVPLVFGGLAVGGVQPVGQKGLDGTRL